MIGQALMNKLLGAALAILATISVVTIVSKNALISSMEKQASNQRSRISSLEETVTALRYNEKTLRSGLDTCNASVNDMHTAADRMDKLGAVAVAEIKKAGMAVESRMATIEGMAGETCEDAFNILKLGGEQ